jgi:hypothetical protein
MQPDDMPPPPDDALLREELAAKGITLGGVIGLAPVPRSACDAGPGASAYLAEDGAVVCRCIVCPRCGHHTGNSHQGHYWQSCKVLAKRVRSGLAPGETLDVGEFMRRTSREFHFCCGNEFGCELETGS